MRSSGRSPRARGSLDRLLVLIVEVGSIPACAGEPRARGTCAARCGVDPRVRGGAALPMYSSIFEKGRSPRARGSLASLVEQLVHPGSIPACAGEPIGMQTLGEDRRVDPRVRGGATGSGSVYGAGQGSIPACAGEPSLALRRLCGMGVDPRVRGGAADEPVVGSDHEGRSPRARGSPPDHHPLPVCNGSIPACTGEPPGMSVATIAESSGRSPRLRGSPQTSGGGAAAWGGRSPRVRGSRLRVGLRVGLLRSIPACAGEPWASACTAGS